MPELWRHVKSGGVYTIVTSGRMESEGEEGKKMIVYRNASDGKTWIRPAREFMDGRFELLPEEEQPTGERGVQKMIYLQGSKIAFRCQCGTNVFTENTLGIYNCNGCEAVYSGE